MNSKLPLHGPGVYLLTFRGARKQPIFRSVFELEACPRLLASLPDTRLIAWLFDNNSLRCIVRCASDWPNTVEALQQALSKQHKEIWGSDHQVLSEQVDVLTIDETGYLMQAVLELHRTPVFEGKVPSADLYPWSSDSFYRLSTPTQWLDSEAVLNRLSHSRHRREQHYISVMEQYAKPEFDLENGNQPTYLALARDRWMEKHTGSKKITSQSESTEKATVAVAWSIAEHLVAQRFGCTLAEISDHQNRRLYQRLQPLVCWLANKAGYSLTEMEHCAEQQRNGHGNLKHPAIDANTLRHWLGRARADHPPKLCKQLLEQYLMQLQNPDEFLAIADVASSNESKPQTGQPHASSENQPLSSTAEAEAPAALSSNSKPNAKANSTDATALPAQQPDANATGSNDNRILNLVQPTG